MFATLPARLKRAVITWPTAAEWGQCAVVSAAILILIGLVAWASGLVQWHPRTYGWPLRLVSVMAIPAFSEELIFRGLLIPTRGESRHPARWIAFGLSAFVLWHVVEATAFLPGAGLFLSPGFLLCAVLLGGGCALMRYRTGSLWPAALLHSLLVFTWQTWLNGPAIADLLRPQG